MNHYHGPRKNTFTREDAYKLVMKDLDIDCVHTDVLYCWGMSKITLPLENKNFAKHDDMKYVEFLEFLGRMSDKRFPDEEGNENNIPLIQKIEMMLDNLFELVNVERKTVSVE